MAIVVCCSGIMRSASTWSYNVCRELVLRTQDPAREAAAFTYANDTDALLASWVKAEQQQERLLRAVMKAHLVGPRTRKLIDAGKLRNVFTIRDPRDAMASMLLFGQEKTEEEKSHLIAYFRAVLRQGLAFLNDGRTLVIRYEDMIADPRRQVGVIARYMGLDATGDLLDAVDAATGAESARAVVARLEAQAAPGEDLSDPVTQLHVTHLNTGEVGRWRRELPPAFVARLEQAFGRAMAAYGYGRDGGAAVPSAAQSPRA